MKNEKYIYKDSSTSIRSNESGFIDKNFQSVNSDGNKFCKIKIRSERIPKIGDKFKRQIYKQDYLKNWLILGCLLCCLNKI